MNGATMAAHVDVPPEHATHALVYVSVNPRAPQLDLYPAHTCALIERGRAAGASSVVLDLREVPGATLHFRADGSHVQTTATGGLRSVFAAHVPPSRRLEC